MLDASVSPGFAICRRSPESLSQVFPYFVGYLLLASEGWVDAIGKVIRRDGLGEVYKDQIFTVGQLLVHGSEADQIFLCFLVVADIFSAAPQKLNIQKFIVPKGIIH
jgi:hypothetical protein